LVNAGFVLATASLVEADVVDFTEDEEAVEGFRMEAVSGA
jgi:hypothetical protein